MTTSTSSCDKQDHLQYLNMDTAVKHCTKGLGIWEWASNDQGFEPDVVMAGCGDIPTKEALAATALLREHFPDLKVRFINVVDLFRMTPESEHPHGLSDRDFDRSRSPQTVRSTVARSGLKGAPSAQFERVRRSRCPKLRIAVSSREGRG